MCEERTRRPNNAAPNERSGLSEWSGGWIAGGFVPLLRSRTDDTRRRSPAKPDGLGGVVSNLNGAAVIFSEGGILSCAAAWSGVLFEAFIAQTMNRQSHSRLLTGRRK